MEYLLTVTPRPLSEVLTKSWHIVIKIKSFSNGKLGDGTGCGEGSVGE